MSHRIGYLTGEYPRATDTFIQREVMGLRALGFHVETISIRRPKQLERAAKPIDTGTTSYVLPPGFFAFLGAHLGSLLTSPVRYARTFVLAMRTRAPGLRGFARQLFYFMEAALVARLVRRHRLAHVHNHFASSSCTVAMLASELGGFPFSFTIHGPAIFYEPHRWRIDEKVRRARFVNCISHFCRSQVMVFSDAGDWDKLCIVHCGVEPDAYGRRDHQGAAKRLVFVGRLARVKGLSVLLRAFRAVHASHPDLALTLVGDGPERTELEQEATDLGVGDAVRFAGYQTAEEVRAHLAGSDVFVMASFAEGVPVVLMEAMAAGLPVIASNVAGTTELVEDGVSGRLVSPGDEAGLVEALSELVEDAALRGRLGLAAQAKVHVAFDIDKEVAHLAAILSASLDGTAVPARPGVANDAVEARS